MRLFEFGSLNNNVMYVRGVKPDLAPNACPTSTSSLASSIPNTISHTISLISRTISLISHTIPYPDIQTSKSMDCNIHLPLVIIPTLKNRTSLRVEFVRLSKPQRRAAQKDEGQREAHHGPDDILRLSSLVARVGAIEDVQLGHFLLVFVVVVNGALFSRGAVTELVVMSCYRGCVSLLLVACLLYFGIWHVERCLDSVRVFLMSGWDVLLRTSASLFLLGLVGTLSLAIFIIASHFREGSVSFFEEAARLMDMSLFRERTGSMVVGTRSKVGGLLLFLFRGFLHSFLVQERK